MEGIDDEEEEGIERRATRRRRGKPGFFIFVSLVEGGRRRGRWKIERRSSTSQQCPHNAAGTCSFFFSILGPLASLLIVLLRFTLFVRCWCLCSSSCASLLSSAPLLPVLAGTRMRMLSAYALLSIFSFLVYFLSSAGVAVLVPPRHPPPLCACCLFTPERLRDAAFCLLIRTLTPLPPVSPLPP